MLRFMERVLGLDLEQYEALMWMHIDNAKEMDDGFLIGPDGEHYVTGEHGSIVTVLTAQQGHSWRGRNRSVGTMRRQAGHRKLVSDKWNGS